MLGGGLTAISSLLVPLFRLFHKGYQLQLGSFALLGAACAFLINPNVIRLATEVNEFCSTSSVVPTYGFLFSIFNLAFTLGDLTGPILAAVIQAQWGAVAAAWVVALLAMAVVPLAHYGETRLEKKINFEGAGEQIPLYGCASIYGST